MPLSFLLLFFTSGGQLSFQNNEWITWKLANRKMILWEFSDVIVVTPTTTTTDTPPVFTD